MVISAKGTRLNRRGLETRRHLLEVAITCLAAHDAADPASASQIAREAGVTWGTVQHQFGDVDGLWAEVLALILDEWELLPSKSAPSPDASPESTADRVAAIVDRFWNLLGTPRARAVNNLRTLLPGDRSELESAYPRTAGAIADWDRVWTASYEGAFIGLPVNQARLRRVRIFLPGALRGLRAEFEMSTYADEPEGRRGLVEAIVVYLATEDR
ncbi:TetR family transcriptional regulator [Williamsia sp. 1135]|uniref:TetR family transcriptional regulator n=1 Tax=Williamsia sp. 1135 TaxID=1889262 RepID=UPI000A0FA2C8|nr:TetR family transcriptional regulator [Williamsia sp. 1135]ORM32156.1 TetR family transcriptional regulator [Williamsia sp. 1135]